jgi:putative membrane protein
MKSKISPNRFTVYLIIALSVAVPLIVILLMNLDTRTNILGLDVGTFPFFHAVINVCRLSAY